MVHSRAFLQGSGPWKTAEIMHIIRLHTKAGGKHAVYLLLWSFRY